MGEERSPRVGILYIYRGVVRKCRLDLLIRLVSGAIFFLETKGQDTEKDRVKRRNLDEWVRAVNAHGGCGCWRSDVALAGGTLRDILAKHAGTAAEAEQRAGSGVLRLPCL